VPSFLQNSIWKVGIGKGKKPNGMPCSMESCRISNIGITDGAHLFAPDVRL
jgi:hypothetical protein